MNISRNAPIGVIDSGVGGLAVLKELTRLYPNENYVYFADNAYMPYGTKTVKTLKNRLLNICHYLIDTFNVKLIIMACHTATVTCLEHLKKNLKIPVTGVEFKNLIADNSRVLCTRLTGKMYDNNKVVVCKALAQHVEDNIFDITTLKRKISKALDKANITEDDIILGCTHYELVHKVFETQHPDKKFILPCKEWVKDLKFNKTLNEAHGDVLMLSSLATKSYIDKLWKIFKT